MTRRFHVVEGTPKPDSPKARVLRRVAQETPADVLQCPRCSGIAAIEVRLGILMQRGRPTGGTKRLVCATCLLKGEHVALT